MNTAPQATARPQAPRVEVRRNAGWYGADAYSILVDGREVAKAPTFKIATLRAARQARTGTGPDGPEPAGVPPARRENVAMSSTARTAFIATLRDTLSPEALAALVPYAFAAAGAAYIGGENDAARQLEGFSDLAVEALGGEEEYQRIAHAGA